MGMSPQTQPLSWDDAITSGPQGRGGPGWTAHHFSTKARSMT